MMFLRFYDDDPISVVCMTISIDTMMCEENLMTMRCGNVAMVKVPLFKTIKYYFHCVLFKAYMHFVLLT